MSPDAAALAAVLDAVQDALRDSIAGGIGTLEDRPESWGFVGTRCEFVLEQLGVARRATPAKSPTFLDCGSGLGFVGAIAREVGFTVTCVEVVPRYVAMSRRLFPSVRVEEADLRTFDRFGAFDVVYHYLPFADEVAQATFERRVEDALRPGGIVIARNKVAHDWRASGAFEQLSHDGLLAWTIQKKAPPCAP